MTVLDSESPLAVMRTLRRRGESFAAGLVVLTEGSTYRKPGALVVVSSQGTRYGAISGGCLEAALETHAREVLRTHSPRSVIFDTRSDDDAVFGSGSGCRGRMTVLLVPDSAPHPSALVDALINADQGHLFLRLALVIEGLGPVLSSGWAWYGADEMALGAAAPALKSWRDRTPGEHRVATAAGELVCAVLDVRPSPRVLLIGAGPEVPALIRLAREMGWMITVTDHRPAALSILLALTERTILARPAAALAQLTGQTFDACVVMTHTAINDLEALQALAGRRETYVGLMGPPARRDELMAQLDATSRAALKGHLRAPVGLHLGGHGPEALALSIVAQLQTVFSKA